MTPCYLLLPLRNNICRSYRRALSTKCLPRHFFSFLVFVPLIANFTRLARYDNEEGFQMARHSVWAHVNKQSACFRKLECARIVARLSPATFLVVALGNKGTGISQTFVDGYVWWLNVAINKNKNLRIRRRRKENVTLVMR